MEIAIKGDQDVPDPTCFDFAKSILAINTAFSDLNQSANRYLNVFVNPGFKGNGAWRLDCLDFGLEYNNGEDEFMASFILDGKQLTDFDIYGRWYVKFLQTKTDQPELSPIAFGRVRT